VRETDSTARVSWTRSPDPRVEGYRIWFDRRDDSLYASSIDVGNETSAVLRIAPNAQIGVTSFIAGAKGLFEQMEGRESWFAERMDAPVTSVRDHSWRIPLRLDLR
jgi:hypothetical protein